MDAAALEPLALWFGFCLAFAMLGFWLWGIVDAARRPAAQWSAAGQSKGLWLVVIVGAGLFACIGSGWIGSLLYLLIPLPALKRARSAPPHPPIPGYHG